MDGLLSLFVSLQRTLVLFSLLSSLNFLLKLASSQFSASHFAGRRTDTHTGCAISQALTDWKISSWMPLYLLGKLSFNIILQFVYLKIFLHSNSFSDFVSQTPDNIDLADLLISSQENTKVFSFQESLLPLQILLTLDLFTTTILFDRLT